MKIFLASHGHLASGLESSAKVLLGATDKLFVYDAYVDKSNLQEVLSLFFSKVDEDEQVILLSDLYGGSVNQIMYQHATRLNTYLVAGVNLAIVMELLLQPEDVSADELDAIVENSRQALKRVVVESTQVEEGSFF